MEYKNQTENRAFQEMLQSAVKRLQNRSGEDIAAKSGAVFHSSRNVLEVLSFYETIEIQLPEFCINSDMDEWHYLTLLHYLDMADGTEGSQKLITFGNLKYGLIRGTKFDQTAEQKLEKLLQDKDEVSTKDFDISDDDTYIMTLLSAVQANDRNSKYKIEFSDEIIKSDKYEISLMIYKRRTAK